MSKQIDTITVINGLQLLYQKTTNGASFIEKLDFLNLLTQCKPLVNSYTHLYDLNILNKYA